MLLSHFRVLLVGFRTRVAPRLAPICSPPERAYPGAAHDFPESVLRFPEELLAGAGVATCPSKPCTPSTHPADGRSIRPGVSCARTGSLFLSAVAPSKSL